MERPGQLDSNWADVYHFDAINLKERDLPKAIRRF
jgi:hypothetical protein